MDGSCDGTRISQVKDLEDAADDVFNRHRAKGVVLPASKLIDADTLGDLCRHGEVITGVDSFGRVVQENPGLYLDRMLSPTAWFVQKKEGVEALEALEKSDAFMRWAEEHVPATEENVKASLLSVSLGCRVGHDTMRRTMGDPFEAKRAMLRLRETVVERLALDLLLGGKVFTAEKDTLVRVQRKWPVDVSRRTVEVNWRWMLQTRLAHKGGLKVLKRWTFRRRWMFRRRLNVPKALTAQFKSAEYKEKLERFCATYGCTNKGISLPPSRDTPPIDVGESVKKLLRTAGWVRDFGKLRAAGRIKRSWVDIWEEVTEPYFDALMKRPRPVAK